MSEHDPSSISPNTESSRELTFADIEDDITSLNVGDVVRFDTAEQYDAAVGAMVWTAMGRVDDPAVRGPYYTRAIGDEKAYITPGSDWRAYYDTINRPSGVFTLPKSQFWGSYQNYSLMMLTDFGEVDEANPRYFLAQAMVSVDLCYSGKGAVATQRKLLTARTLRHHDHGALQVKYKNMSGNNTEKALELLKRESASNVRLIALRGLERVVSAGLPSLGKRR